MGPGGGAAGGPRFDPSRIPLYGADGRSVHRDDLSRGGAYPGKPGSCGNGWFREFDLGCTHPGALFFRPTTVDTLLVQSGLWRRSIAGGELFDTASPDPGSRVHLRLE